MATSPAELNDFLQNRCLAPLTVSKISRLICNQRGPLGKLTLRGTAKGEPTAQLARELDISRKQIYTQCGWVQNRLYETLFTDVLDEPVFETDELYQNAGIKAIPPGRMQPVPAAGQQAAQAQHL